MLGKVASLLSVGSFSSWGLSSEEPSIENPPLTASPTVLEVPNEALAELSESDSGLSSTAPLLPSSAAEELQAAVNEIIKMQRASRISCGTEILETLRAVK